MFVIVCLAGVPVFSQEKSDTKKKTPRRQERPRQESLKRPFLAPWCLGVYSYSSRMQKKLIWIGLFVGSTVGNMLPLLWGGDAISISGVLLSLAGGIAGIWIGYRVGRSI